VPIRQLFVVTIEFAGAAFFTGGAHSDRVLASRDIRVVESRTGSSRSFSLHEGDGLEYTLSVEEAAQLDHLLGQIGVKVPWQASAGLDGADYELTLQAAMSSVTFRWWIDVPAEWPGVGALFDYVLAVADGCRAGGS
jgi:hypothetical protein